MKMKFYRYIYIIPLVLMLACTEGGDEPAKACGDIYIAVDINSQQSRVAYDFSSGEGVNAKGNIRASWQLGDIIKVYETGIYSGEAYTDVYADYEAYESAHPYPSAPTKDTYYRFVCVGGEGTTRGVFKYVGLATATVLKNPTTGINNINVDIKYNHEIRNWDKFDGLVIYGTPLRNQLMRTQTAPNDLSHLRFGERMCGHMCTHNFQWWYDQDPAPDGPGADRLVLKNVGGCIYRIIIGAIDVDIYGGSSLTLSIPGVTDKTDKNGDPLGSMTLILGNLTDFQLGLDPWARYKKHTDPNESLEPNVPYVPDDEFCAYIVGWDGFMPATEAATLTLYEYRSKASYTWQLTSTTDIDFKEGLYYTIDLRNREYTKTR